jgi:trehalose synthase
MSRIAKRYLPYSPIAIVATFLALAGCHSAKADAGKADAAGTENRIGDDVRSLEMVSMLFQANQQARAVSGSGEQWRHHFGDPQPQDTVKAASVWLLHYPAAVITQPGQSVIATWGQPQFWDTLRDVGIDLLHTNPIERAGGIQNGQFTASIDGGFDRISMDIDPQLGTEQEYRAMVQTAGQRGGSLGGDLVPLHTGLGADFRLATKAYGDYPGVYSIVEIRQEDWGLLPMVNGDSETALISKEVGAQLTNKGYIPGIINSADADPMTKMSAGWSATGEIAGVDGKQRRWVYLHVFKRQQPVLNWSDPSYAGRRVAIGDAVRNIHDLGNKVVRLDAVPFLGIDPQKGNVMAALFLHPLSVTGGNDLAFTVRKLGGWSFQELNVPMDQYKEFSRNGPDLAYDFFTRAEAIHPVLSQDVRPLRLEHQQLLIKGLKHGSLIHDLQNHDEITFQLVNLGSLGDVEVDGEKVNGQQLKNMILDQMRSGVAGDAAPYNKLYRTEKDGVATTFAGFIAPALGIKDPYHATPDQVAMIKKGHLLVAMANAMQPGVFGVSSWDLVGALPVPEQLVADRLGDADYRWVNRGAVDLLGVNPAADKSVFGLPKATVLYGTLPEQLAAPDSFASQLKKMLAARKKYRIPEAEMVAVPSTGDRAVLVMIMKLPDNKGAAVTAVNYGREQRMVTVNLSDASGDLPKDGQAHDIVADQDVGAVSGGKFTLSLDALTARTVEIH